MVYPTELLQPKLSPIEELRRELTEKFPLKEIEIKGGKVVMVDDPNFDRNSGIRFATFPGSQPRTYIEIALPATKTSKIDTKDGKELKVHFVPAAEDKFTGPITVPDLKVGSVALVRVPDREGNKPRTVIRRIEKLEVRERNWIEFVLFEAVDPLANPTEKPKCERLEPDQILGIVVGIA